MVCGTSIAGYMAGHGAPRNLAIETARKDKEMPQTMEIPDKHQAAMKAVQIDVSAGKGDDKVEAKFDAELPATLEDAIAAFGKKEVFRRFINAHVVYLQSQERNKIAKQTEEKERKRAPYLESIGL
jgi:hypothetical protein